MPTNNGGTFQPLLHRSGTLRERLHSYTKRTLGAGGSINEAVSLAFRASDYHIQSIHFAVSVRMHSPFFVFLT